MLDEMVAFLLHRQTHAACLRRCVDHISPHVEVRRAVRSAVSIMMDHSFFTITYRSALLREIAGTRHRSAVLSALSDDLAEVAHRTARHCREAAHRSAFRLDVIGPRHAAAVERDTMVRVESHARKFAQLRARFLSMAEHGRTLDDLTSDVRTPGLRCFRWYYPFRAGTHMDNTVRTTITNRGLSYIKKETRQCRQRMVEGANGSTVNMESYQDLEGFAATASVERDAVARLDVATLLRRRDVVGRIARVVLLEPRRDDYLSWQQKHQNLPPLEALGTYLRVSSRAEVRAAVHQIRELCA